MKRGIGDVGRGEMGLCFYMIAVRMPLRISVRVLRESIAKLDTNKSQTYSYKLFNVDNGYVTDAVTAVVFLFTLFVEINYFH